MQSNTQTAEKEGFANHNEIDYIARQSDFQVHTTPWYVLANLETPATFLLQGWTGAFSHKTRRGKERCNDQPVKCSRDTSRGVLRSLKGTFYGALLSNDRTIPWKTISSIPIVFRKTNDICARKNLVATEYQVFSTFLSDVYIEYVLCDVTTETSKFRGISVTRSSRKITGK